MVHRYLVGFAIVSSVVAVLAGGSTPALAEECTMIHVVEVTHIFTPRDIVINKGDCIRFVNIHSIEHSAIGGEREFTTGTMPSGGASLIEFSESGEIPYLCGLHPPMVGKIVVK